MLYGLPSNLGRPNLPSSTNTRKEESKKPKAALASTERGIGQGHEDQGSVLPGSRKLSSPEPRLCVQPWSAIFPKCILEYVIIPLASHIFPRILKKHIDDAVRFALVMIEQPISKKPGCISGKTKEAYIDNLVRDLNLYMSDPALNKVVEQSVKNFLEMKFSCFGSDEKTVVISVNKMNELSAYSRNISAFTLNGEDQSHDNFIEFLKNQIRELIAGAEIDIRQHDAFNTIEKDGAAKIKNHSNVSISRLIGYREMEGCGDEIKGIAYFHSTSSDDE